MASMQLNFTMSLEKKGIWDVIRFGGAITEDAGVQFIQLYGQTGAKVLFNFRDVTNINSNGLRAWMVFLRDFQNDRELALEECTPVIVNQMNMLPSFTQKAKVLSVYVPFHCESCQTMTMTLMTERDFPSDGAAPKAPRCKACMNPTVYDEDEYFMFLER